MTAKVSAAFVKAQAEIEKASKDRTNPHFRSKYADLGAVVDAIKPALEKHGLGFLQKFHHDEKGITVETIIVHESGETLSNGVLNVPASKMDAQGFGSACTYARRYSLQAAFGVAPEDDDGNAASRNNRHQDTSSPVDACPEAQPTEADAMIVAQFNAAQSMPDLVKIMNGLPKEQQSIVRPHFNQRKDELKKAA
jgi:hypothetical protein